MMNKISRPTFVVIEKIARENIRRMSRKFSSRNIRFRPHFKTHQSEEIGEWFREEGISQISVSSVDMALKFARAGWRDILIAFPFNRLQLDEVNTISKGNTISIVLEDADTARYVSANTSAPLQVYIKVDCGYGRTESPPIKVKSLPNL